MNSPVAPQNLNIELRSILEPLNVAEYFLKAQPLEIELGCGDASFLLNYAKAHPERNFIGVERLGGRIRKLDRKGRRAASLIFAACASSPDIFWNISCRPNPRPPCTFIFPTPGPSGNI